MYWNLSVIMSDGFALVKRVLSFRWGFPMEESSLRENPTTWGTVGKAPLHFGAASSEAVFWTRFPLTTYIRGPKLRVWAISVAQIFFHFLRVVRKGSCRPRFPEKRIC